MGAKPPVLLSKTPKGVVASAPDSKAVTPSSSDKLLDSIEWMSKQVIPRRHRIIVLERLDRSQFMPFHADCSCGWASKSRSRSDLDRHVERHKVEHGF